MGSWKDSEALWDWDNRLCNNELLFNQEVHLASRGSLSRWMFTWLMNNISICNRHWRGQPQCQIPAAVQGFWTSAEFTFYFSGETIKNRVSACGWKRTPHASHNLLIHLECVRKPHSQPLYISACTCFVFVIWDKNRAFKTTCLLMQLYLVILPQKNVFLKSIV